MIGVGIIGTGFGRMVHIPGFMSLDGVKVVGIASGTYEAARQTAEAYNLAHAFKSWRELIACSEIQGVSIATPPYLHEEIALAAVMEGKAVLCEKPMALNAVQASNMLREAKKMNMVHMVDFEFREIPAFRFAKRIVEKGDLGKIRHVTVQWVISSWADPQRPWTWRAEKSMGGGTLGALGVHVFDYTEWLLGPVKALFSHLTTHVRERRGSDGTARAVNTEDCCQLILELESGVPVSLFISAVAPESRGHRIEIDGEEGTLVVGSAEHRDYGKGFQVWKSAEKSEGLRLLTVPGEMCFSQEWGDGRIAPFQRIAKRFVEAIQDDRERATPSFEEGYRARLLMDKAFESNANRSWVTVDDQPSVRVDRD